MALDLTTRKEAAPAQQQRVGLSTFVRNKLSKTMTGKKLDDFCTAVVSLVNNNPQLATCDQISLLSSCLQAQSLNLSLNQGLGQAYIVPFKNKKRGTSDATFVLGYRGLIQLAIRSGQYRRLNVLPIKAGELRSWDPLNEEIEIELISDAREREKAETIGYYACFEYLNGFRKALYWSHEEMEAHADRYSQAFSLRSYRDLKAGKIKKEDEWKYSSFWYKDFDAMGCKTLLRQLISKWGVMSTEMQTAILSDSKAEDSELFDGTVLDTEYGQTAETAEVVEAEIVDADTGEVQEAPIPTASKKEKVAKKSQPVAENTPTEEASPVTELECPARGDLPVSVAYCNSKCDKRHGCPAWPE